MTKTQAIQKIDSEFPEARFVANVVLCWHRNPASKLKGMLALLRAGHSVSCGANIDHLLIDGYSAHWNELDATPDELAS